MAEQLINLGMQREDGFMMVSENDIQGYQERIRREIQRLSHGKTDIFEQLYDQRVRSTERFEMLKSILEQEKEIDFVKNCTFKPIINHTKKSFGNNFSPQTVHEIDQDIRSPDKFFADQMDF